MKVRVYVNLLAFISTALVSIIVISLCIFYSPSLIKAESFLIQNQLVLAKQCFPLFYKQWVFFSVCFLIVGLVISLYAYFRFIIWWYLQLPSYAENKKIFLGLALTTLIVIFFLLGLAVAEFILRSKSPTYSCMFLSCRLTPPETWVQKDIADERGMNYSSPKYSWGDQLHHVNTQGFLANWDYDKTTIDSFKHLGYKIVFVIGDSYTEGVTSSTWNNTFCELAKTELFKKKYLLCPFGVGGTDVIQYRLVAEKFIPALNPDIVVVAFCGCNDFIMFDRKPTPFVPLHYQTNIGYMSSNISCNRVICTTPDSLYRFYTSLSPKGRPSFLITYLNAIVTGWKDPVFEYSFSDTSTATQRNLAQVRSLTVKDNGRFFVAFTPDVKVPNLRSRNEADSLYAKLFGDIQNDVKYYLKGNLSENDYQFPKTMPHFNDSGNRKFADFLIEEILKQ